MNFVLHLGAHRTGSTSLQNYFHANLAALSAAGMEVWLPAQLRRIPDFGRAPSLVEIGGSESARRINALRFTLGGLVDSAPASTILLSEENLLGGMQGNLVSRSLYSSLEVRLRVYIDLLRLTPVRIGLAIRSYESYWLSCYLHVLRRRALLPIAQYTDELANSCEYRGWCEVVAGIRTCFPTSEICVWQSEATKHAGVRNVATRLVDGKVNLASMPRNEASHIGLQIGYLSDLEDLRRQRPALSRKEIDLHLQGMKLPAPISPFTQSQSETMAKSYARCVERIASMTNVKLWSVTQA